jgi:hypothetical protein
LELSQLHGHNDGIDEQKWGDIELPSSLYCTLRASGMSIGHTGLSLQATYRKNIAITAQNTRYQGATPLGNYDDKVCQADFVSPFADNWETKTKLLGLGKCICKAYLRAWNPKLWGRYVI